MQTGWWHAPLTLQGYSQSNIHKGENILHLQVIKLGRPQWEPTTTTTMLPNTDE